MLYDPYCEGWVTVDGQLVPGRHEAIVSQSLFDRVQQVLDSRSARGQRDRVLFHYLIGMLFLRPPSRKYYGYFLCRARQEDQCALPHLAAWQVEDAISEHYAFLSVPEDFAAAVRQQIEQTITDQSD